MRPPKKKPPRKRNLAAKVLRDPLFRPKVMANPNAYRRRRRFVTRPEDEANGDDN